DPQAPSLEHPTAGLRQPVAGRLRDAPAAAHPAGGRQDGQVRHALRLLEGPPGVGPPADPRGGCAGESRALVPRSPLRIMEFLLLLGKTLLLRPYVFLFLALALATSVWLMGPKRAAIFFLLTWLTAFLCEFSSTRTGIPFGWYFYTGSTRGQELYLSNMPFMDSLSFSFLLFTSYCLALVFLLPAKGSGLGMVIHDDRATRTSIPVLGLTVLFFVLLDVVIDPVALRGDRWFLGKI